MAEKQQKVHIGLYADKSLAEKIKTMAAKEGRSVNSMILQLLRKTVKA